MNVSLSRDNAATVVTLGGHEFMFSYETIVAFREDYRWVASENIWSQTTGKHIKQVTGVEPKDRIPHYEFTERLDALLEKFSVAS